MTTYDATWAAAEEAKRAWMNDNSLFREEDEHSSCGVGLVVSIDGTPSRKVVENGINALKAVWHRGAVDADGKTGDGAGIHVQIPATFFYDQVRRTGHEPRMDELMAVGQVFLPRTNFAAQETCRTIVESEVLRMGYYIYGWRHVPVNVSVLGEKANATRPEIEQIIISNAKGVDEETFERELYVIRRRIEKAAQAAGIKELYLCSFSCRSIIYKGMMLAQDVAEFYPDLKDERFESAFAIYHQRYSTNTFPQWWLAQPFRMLAHNGEINTLKGNTNWMKSHEIRMASTYFGEMAEDIKPIIPQGSSDSGALDAVFEVLVRAGRSAPMAKTMLVPEAWSNTATELPKAWQDMYSYCNSVMEPWDGPAALAMTDGRWVCAGLDRNGLRPMRYVVTGEGMLIAGSEAGMVPVNEATVVEKGALGPGQMIAVDMKNGGLFHDTEIKDKLAAARPFGDWVGKIVDLAAETEGATEKTAVRRCRAAPPSGRGGLFHRRTGTDPCAHGRGREGTACLDGRRHARGGAFEHLPPAVAFLSPEFQPGHQPANRQLARKPRDEPENAVRQPQERAGRRQQPDRDPRAGKPVRRQCPVRGDGDAFQRRSWSRSTAPFRRWRPADALSRGAGAHPRHAAEDAVRSGAGHIILTDQGQSKDRVAMPMILATSAVHSWLTRQGLRTFCSLNVRSAECIDPHYFAVLVGCGATTVNAYLAQDSIADRINRGLIEGTLTEAMARYRAAVDAGLLKIMSKMGISVLSSYRGGLNFEAVGLSRAMVAEYFPGMLSRISGIGVSGLQKKAAGCARASGFGAAGQTCCPSAGSTRRAGRVKSTLGKRRRCICCRRPATVRPMRCGSSIPQDAEQSADPPARPARH